MFLPPAAPGETDTAARTAEAIRFFKLLDLQRMAVRTLPNPREMYGDWTELDALATAAVDLSLPPDLASDVQGAYVVINSVEEHAFLNFANGQGDGGAVSDRHIDARTNFYIDIDPKRFVDGDAKVSANDLERQWAEAALEQVLMITALYGFSEPLVVDSGNGYQVHFRIALPNDDGAKTLVKSVLQAFAAIINCDRGEIDTTVGNAARLARIPGTYNRKGRHSIDRPHRMATIVKAPADDMLQLTEQAVLRDFVQAFEIATDSATGRSCTVSRTPTGLELDLATFNGLVDEIVAYLRENGAPPVKEVKRDAKKAIVTLSHCPFRGETHADGDPGVLVWRTGSLGYKCFHAKCADDTWQNLQGLLGPSFYSPSLVAYAGEHSTKLPRRHNDPLFLAQVHLEQTRLPDGGPSLVFLHGEMHRYLPRAGWREVSSRELHAPVRTTIQRVFDANSISKPSTKFCQQVTAARITNTVKALDSIAYFEADPALAPPFWLTPDQTSNPLNLLVLRNSVLDIMAWAEGREHFFPSTSKLFSKSVGDYDFDPTCRHSPVWLDFLASLEQDAEWVRLLQEIMGCSLCAGYDLQKIFMLVGPPRCGKGTITRALESIIGPQNVCSPNLIDFAKPFGLEQAFGTRLAIVPEVAFPPRNTPQIVATLKAISGGDLVTVDRKFIKNVPVRLPMKIMLVTNNFIALPDNSKALPSRVIPLRFTKSFLGMEDITLSNRLLDERSAILNWSLEGFRRLVAGGGQFTLPTSSREMMEQLHIESAPLQSFIEDQCVLDPRKATYKQSLFERYKSWTKANDPDRPLLTKGDFNRELMTAASQVSSKRPSNRDLNQSTYVVVPTEWDAKIEDKRPEVWIGIYVKPV